MAIKPSIGLRIRHREQARIRSSTRGRESQELLQVGADADRAEEIEERHGAIGRIITGQPPVTHLLYKGHRGERKLSHGLPFEERIEETEDDKENDCHNGARLELGEGEVAARFLEAGLNAVHLLGLGSLGEGRGGSRQGR